MVSIGSSVQLAINSLHATVMIVDACRALQVESELLCCVLEKERSLSARIKKFGI